MPIDERSRCGDDRHHFPIIVSPDGALEMSDLKTFARDLAAQMERTSVPGSVGSASII
jgi:type IV secretory pathway VirD2 relaxase